MPYYCIIISTILHLLLTLVIGINIKINDDSAVLLAKNQSFWQNNQQIEKKDIQLNLQQILLINNIRNQLKQCWTIPQPIYGRDKVEDIVIELKLAINGKIEDISYQQTRIYDPRAHATLNNALRAIYKCTPIQDLPEEQHEVWREISLKFHYNK